MFSPSRISSVIAGTVIAAITASGCTWDYLIWSKSKKSDTPLFRFVISEHGGVGYIDRDGKVVIQPTLSQLGNYGDDDFFDGLAKVSRNDEDWYVDRTGKPVFRSDLDSGHFSEGLARRVSDGKTGFVDREGKLVIPATFDSAGDFSGGLAAVAVDLDYGYINRDGSFAVRPRFKRAEPFADGAARVIEDGPCSYTGHGPCDSGPVTLPESPDTLPYALPGCRYSFIDRQGKRLFEPTFLDAKDFAEGLAPVSDGQHWGYVDKKGTVVIPMRYQDAEPFAEGLARVQLDDKWGYIDKNGKMVIPAAYPSAQDFSEGVAVVGDGASKNWYIDKNGHQAIPHFYTIASSFAMGRAHVRDGAKSETAKWSYIDHSGHAVFTYSYQSDRKR